MNDTARCGMVVPSNGLCVPASWRRVIRGDRLEVAIEGRPVEVALIGCRAPSISTPEGRAAAHWLEAWLETCAERPVAVWLPWRRTLADLVARVERNHRLAGRVFCGTADLSVLLVANGHALWRPTPLNDDHP